MCIDKIKSHKSYQKMLNKISPSPKLPLPSLIHRVTRSRGQFKALCAIPIGKTGHLTQQLQISQSCFIKLHVHLKVFDSKTMVSEMK